MPPSTTLPRNRSAHSMTHAGRWMGLTASNTQSCTHVRLTNYHAHSYPLLPFNSLRLKLLYPGAAWPPTSALPERHHFRTAFTHCFGLSFGPTTDLSPPLSDIAPCFSDTNFDSQQRNGTDLTMCIYLHFAVGLSLSDYYSHHCTIRQSHLAVILVTSPRTIRTYCSIRIRCTLHLLILS